MTKKWWIIGGVGAAVLLAVALAWASFHVPPAPGGYTEVAANVVYYPACGNETLEHDGKTWYPVSRDWPTPGAQAAGASGGRGVATSLLAAVAPPGPGDGAGDLYLYPRGLAFWVSNSGNLHTWLTVVPQTYNWVC